MNWITEQLRDCNSNSCASVLCIIPEVYHGMLHGISLTTLEERESLDRESLSLYKYILSSHVQILFGKIIIVEKV